jgi:hypothetical protein
MASVGQVGVLPRKRSTKKLLPLNSGAAYELCLQAQLRKALEASELANEGKIGGGAGFAESSAPRTTPEGLLNVAPEAERRSNIFNDLAAGQIGVESYEVQPKTFLRAELCCHNK